MSKDAETKDGAREVGHLPSKLAIKNLFKKKNGESNFKSVKKIVGPLQN